MFQEVGDGRHAGAGDVLEDLEHLGPFFQVADREFGVAHRLTDEVFAAGDEAVEASAVGALGVGLTFDPAAVVGPVEVFRGEFAKLLVGGVQLQLAVAHFEGLLMPLAQLFGQPDGMLFGI